VKVYTLVWLASKFSGQSWALSDPASVAPPSAGYCGAFTAGL
ncbi:uncharacterized protein METZ01_LOCUS139264, partial [marine metagenome]